MTDPSPRPLSDGPSFQSALRTYAELIVSVGLNLQPGQGLLVRAPLEAAPLVRRVGEAAYRLGSPLVEVSWSDDELTRLRFQHAPDDSFERVPRWRADGYLAMARDGFASLSVLAGDPDLLAGTDPDRWAAYSRAWQVANRPFQAMAMTDRIAWCVVGYAGRAWARKAFPGRDDAAAVAALWEAIFAATRVELPDPPRGWREHSDGLEARARRLDERRYAALRFRGPGTDLRVGLADGHLWDGGGSVTRSGTPFVPNMPTEEIFTAPHRERVDGRVRASMPLAHGGSVIDGLTLRFERGAVVEAHADRGQAELERLLDTDEGARRLGEVALVPVSSPIARSGVLFFETLFDENAASHIALGAAYPTSVEGGADLGEAEARRAGLNSSVTHVDFMIGSADMDVDGETADGGLEPLMRGGEWVEG